MSTMQELIHTNARLAYQQGSNQERQKTLALLSGLLTEVKKLPFKQYEAARVVTTMRTIENIMCAYQEDKDLPYLIGQITDRCEK